MGKTTFIFAGSNGAIVELKALDCSGSAFFSFSFISGVI